MQKRITVIILILKKFLKIKKFFKYIRILKKIRKNFSNKIAISVSGGPDSMALCFLIYCYKFIKIKKFNLYFYLVDHGLRKNSAQEAKIVKKHLKFKKINLKILKMERKKPNSNLQSLARQKRYEFLFNECKK